MYLPGRCCVAAGILCCRDIRICWLLNMFGPYEFWAVGLGGSVKPSENEFCRIVCVTGELIERCRCAWYCRAALL